jgi:site-specific recombinase XerD
VNDFLDAQAARGLSLRSLRAYGYSLLNFSRWKTEAGCELSGLKEADLLDYIRFQEANAPVMVQRFHSTPLFATSLLLGDT